jgi:sigma-B regulation protein RsbU (phosphoserine phosphatase)
MRHRASLRRAAVFFLLLAACAATAQRFDLDHDRQPVVALDGMWRFHPGDDPRWADPGFDDSQWPLLHSDRDWNQQGYKGLSGVAWYRFQVAVPAGTTPISLYVPSIRTSYEIYVDGQPIGGLGGMPPHAKMDTSIPKLFALPHTTPAAHTLTVAIRVWLPSSSASIYGGGPAGTVLIGDATLLAQRARGAVYQRSWFQVSTILVNAFDLLAGLAGLAFFYFRPREREYLWFGLMMLDQAFSNGVDIWLQNHAIGVSLVNASTWTLGSLFAVATMLFFRRLTQSPRNVFFWIAFASCWFIAGVGLLIGCDALDLTIANTATLILLVPFMLWATIVLVRAAWRGVADARLLLIPIVFQYSTYLIGLGLQVSYVAGWQHKTGTRDPILSSWPFFFTLSDLAAVLFLVAMGAILIARFTRSRREEERYAGEMEAARVVQQVLLPEPNVGLKGFSVVAEYLSAQEVGGDFYQIVRTRDGGLLVVTGDVSGKGMPAAMLVALLVGAIRTEAAHTSDPATLLETLNARVHGRMNSGFATCAALHIAADGSALLSNAANPSPYLNGEEIALAGALPLGMVSEVEYENHRFTLHPGDILTFVSDGVIEATKLDTGELFGFDRTRALSHLPALEIAQTARAFGQTDDITVLTVTRLQEEPA